MTQSGLILLALAAPLALAILSSLRPSGPAGHLLARGRAGRVHRIADFLAPWAALPALIVALYAGDGGIELPWLLLGTQLGLTPLTRVFLLFTALLWLLAGQFARADLAGDPRRGRFDAFFLAAFTGNIGLILARDVGAFYLFFALMTFAAYGLVVHSGEPQARHAGRVYIIMAVLGEAALLAGLMLAAGTADSLAIAQLPEAIATAPQRDVIVALLMAGFGVKAGAIVLHLWLPLAHPVAPTAASAVLSGAMIKAGLLGWLLFLPLGAAHAPAWGTFIIAAGITAAFYAAIAGTLQDDAKTVLAYSSISQMGFMTAAVGSAFAAPSSAPAAIAAAAAYALHHGLAKGALFLGVRAATGTYPRPWIPLALLALPAVALTGAPLTGGAIAKLYLKDALPEVAWAGRVDLLLSLAAMGTTLIMARFLFLMHIKLAGGTTKALPARGSAAWLASVATAMTLMWLVPQQLLSIPTGKVALWSALWPVLAGGTLAACVMLLPGKHRQWRVPPGDLVVVAEAIYGAAVQGLRRVETAFEALIGAGFARLSAYRERLQERNAALSGRGERALRSGAGLTVFLILLLLAAAASWM